MTKRFPVLGLFFSRLLGVLPGVLALATLLALAPASQADEPDAAKGPAGRRLPYYVAMDPPIVYPGAIVRLQVRPPADADGGSVAVAGRRYLGRIEDGLFVAYFAVDIDTLPGPYELSWDVGSRHGSRMVTVRARRMDEAGRGDRERTRQDLQVEELVHTNPKLVGLWNRTTLAPYWKGAFETPCGGDMVGTFAMRSSTETSLGSPHSGVDLAPKAGSKVVAPGNAVVALTAEAAGTGLVVLDHGFGLYTLLSGMDDVYVARASRCVAARWSGACRARASRCCISACASAGRRSIP